MTTEGHAFIEAYASFEPTTIVLDMIMPGMDGNELVSGSRSGSARRASSSLPDIRPTMPRTPGSSRNIKGLGPVTTLHKPVEIGRLRAVLGPQDSSCRSPRKPGTRSCRVGR